MKKSLKRYTDLPFLLDYLSTKKLALLNPKTWDDTNDSHYINVYVQSKNYDSAYALCLTGAKETYHHWKVFTTGSSGVCIEFYKDTLLNHIGKLPELRAQSVQYKTIGKIKKQPPGEEQLPFLKHWAFRDECEFRIFFSAKGVVAPIYQFVVPGNAIKKIILSPWIPAAVAEKVKGSINAMAGCKSLRVSQSSLIDNEKWKQFAFVAKKAANDV